MKKHIWVVVAFILIFAGGHAYAQSYSEPGTPDNLVGPHYNKGIALMNNGLYREAADEFLIAYQNMPDIVLKNDPNKPFRIKILRKLGECEFKDGQYIPAIIVYRKACNLGDTYSCGMENEIEKITGTHAPPGSHTPQ